LKRNSYNGTLNVRTIPGIQVILDSQVILDNRVIPDNRVILDNRVIPDSRAIPDNRVILDSKAPTDNREVVVGSKAIPHTKSRLIPQNNQDISADSVISKNLLNRDTISINLGSIIGNYRNNHYSFCSY
jgi:hypothetical protein